VQLGLLLVTDYPLSGLLDLTSGEEADVCRNKVRSQMLGEITEVRVGYDRDFLDMLVVIAHEPYVSHQRPEAVPTRKVRRVDDEAGKSAARLDFGINDFGKFSEVTFLER
jgi:hypothetical protein